MSAQKSMCRLYFSLHMRKVERREAPKWAGRQAA
jgi:hypothetical protein